MSGIRVVASFLIGGLTLWACTPGSTTLQQTNGTAPQQGSTQVTNQATNQPSLQVGGLAPYQNAQVADIAIGADGTLHGVLNDYATPGTTPQIYYVSSTDGGATWSKPQNISQEPDRADVSVRLVADGQGQIYAIWKSTQSSVATGVETGTWDFPGSLRYRVLSGGQWSPTIAVQNDELTNSWYADVNGQGQISLVSLRQDHDLSNPTHFKGQFYAGAFFQQTLSSSSAGVPTQVFQGLIHDSDGPTDSYGGLQGVITSSGTPHWVAMRQDTPDTLVYFDGTHENQLFTKTSRFKSPALFAGADGTEHVIVIDNGATPPGIYDYPTVANGTGTPLLTFPNDSGKVNWFQLSHLGNGRAEVLVEANNTPAGQAEPTDLYGIGFDGQAWGSPLNLTDNASTASSTQVTDATNNFAINQSHNADFAMGALDGSGHLNFLLVADNANAYLGFNTMTHNVYFGKR